MRVLVLILALCFGGETWATTVTVAPSADGQELSNTAATYATLAYSSSNCTSTAQTSSKDASAVNRNSNVLVGCYDMTGQITGTIQTLTWKMYSSTAATDSSRNMVCGYHVWNETCDDSSGNWSTTADTGSAIAVSIPIATITPGATKDYAFGNIPTNANSTKI